MKTKNMQNVDALVDRNEIAHILGIGPTAVSNYVARTSDRHPEFPEPVVVRSHGRFRLWHILDVISWHGDAFPKRTGLFANYWDSLDEYRGNQS